MSESDTIINTSDQQQPKKKCELERIDELYTQDIATLSDSEIQLSLALEYAFQETSYASFEHTFSEMFQSLHERSLTEGNSSTISFDQYQSSGLPKPSLELKECKLIHHELLQESGLLSHFDF